LDIGEKTKGNSSETALSLDGFSNLEELNCQLNEITDLDLSHCFNLTKLNCSDNRLSNLSFLTSLPEPKKLTHLNISGNNLVANLDTFSRFDNLEELNISNNRFEGSLEPLKGMKNLKKIDISYTDLDKGLEFLFNDETEIGYDSYNGAFKVVKIEKELQPLRKEKSSYESSSKPREINSQK